MIFRGLERYRNIDVAKSIPRRHIRPAVEEYSILLGNGQVIRQHGKLYQANLPRVSGIRFEVLLSKDRE